MSWPLESDGVHPCSWHAVTSNEEAYCLSQWIFLLFASIHARFSTRASAIRALIVSMGNSTTVF